jgi:outer membrane lipoprotein-sorting protein
VIALLLLTLAAPGDLVTQVKAKLQDASVLQGTFEQSKQVKGFKRPLKSSGTYVVKKGEGVQWNTLKPFPSELTVRAGDITSKQGDKEVFKLDAKSEPTVRVITQLLFSLLAGDLAALGTWFEASGTVGEREWRIELTPKTDGLKKVFMKIALSGDASVRSVHLMELNGDATLITLTPTPAP